MNHASYQRILFMFNNLFKSDDDSIWYNYVQFNLIDFGSDDN